MELSHPMIDSYPHESRNRILKRVSELAPFLEMLPGVAIIHDIRDGSVVYMTSKGLKQLGVTMEELAAMGTNYYPKFFNMEEAREYVPQMLAMVERNDPSETFTIFQQVKFAENNNWNWHLSSIRILEHNNEGQPIATLTLAQLITPDQHYTPKIERLLDELTFLRTNFKTFSSLSKRECDVIKLLASGKTSVQIADELHLSVKTIETHRKNIRRKLDAKTQADISRYARAFDLI